MKLPPSRIHDGICDCCDGADESNILLHGDNRTPCENVCDELLRQEREERARLQATFALGHNKRKHEVFAFKKLQETKRQEVQDLEKEQQQKEEELQTTQDQLSKLEAEYSSKRLQTVSDTISTSKNHALSWFQALTRTELEAFLVHACQLAGEMATTEDTFTCAALRLAGLDLSMTWNEDNYFGSEKTLQLKSLSATDDGLANRLFSNAVQDAAKTWTLSSDNSKSGRRRLDEEYFSDDDSYHPDTDDYYRDDDHHDEDEEEDYEEYRERNRKRNGRYNPSKSKKTELSGKEKEFVETIKASSFSDTRAAFLERSVEILADISKVLDSDDTSDEETKEANAVDPAAYAMVRNTLGTKEGTITKGLRWGASARLFLSANPNLTEEQLRQLSIMTVYHGKLSAVQVWQIVQKTVAEFAVAPTDKETCASPWAGFCPPKTITRKRITIPSPDIVKAAETFCSSQTQVAMEACAAKATDVNGIPSSIPDGYYGYSAAIARTEQDPLTKLFAPIDTLPVDKKTATSLEEKKTKLEKEKSDVSKAITDAWKEIGGKEPTKMGRNGELHALSDKCFDVEAGKYTYELCIFGKAAQKEGKSSTSLGQYANIEYNDETGERILRWQNGQKCWNGPARSATAYVACGAETKVISAHEPDTCQYVMHMESHIACDEALKARLGL